MLVQRASEAERRPGYACIKFYEPALAGDRNLPPATAYSRFAATLAGLDGDDLAIIHAGIITKRIHLARETSTPLKRENRTR